MNYSELQNIAGKLVEFVDTFKPVFSWKRRVEHCQTYLTGLMLDGERKSIEPIAGRIEGANDQALQQFVNQSPWDAFELQKALRIDIKSRFRINKATYILDDTSLPKKGKKSVGVSHQYCGALGKTANCQSIVSLHGVTPRSHLPLAGKLYLPESWNSDSVRMDKAGVPKEERKFKEKWKIALELIDESKKDIEISELLMDAGYGCNREFLGELDTRNIKFIADLRGDETIWRKDVEFKNPESNSKGKPNVHLVPEDISQAKINLKEEAKRLFSDKKNIKKITIPHNTPIKVEYCAMRVYEITRRPRPHKGPERWLISRWR